MPRLSRPAMVRSIAPLTLLVALLGLAPPARAGFVEYDITRARLAMQRADYLLDDAQYAADVARDDFERADRRAAELAQDIDRQQRDVDDASRRFDEAVRSAKWLREDLDRCLDRVDARRKELDEAAERLRAARDATDKLTADEVARFEAGDQFKSLTAAVEEAGKALEAAEKAALDALGQSDDHRAARTAAEALRTRVDFLTDQGDRAAPDELSAAIKELADAQARLRNLEDRHLAADPKVKDAEVRLTQAQQAVKALRDDFDKQLGQRPEIADARRAAAAAQQAYDDALRVMRDAEGRLAVAEDQLKKQDEVVALEQDKVKAGNDNFNRLLDEVREADSFAAASQRRLRDALEALECARRERDAAAWSLARAEQAADAFYGWGTPVYGAWTAVHVGVVHCAPRPVYVDPDCYRPTWCRPLADFHRPHYGHWYHHRRPVYVDDCRPVVVKVTRVRSPVFVPVRETAREKAVRLASRNGGDEQRRQRQAVVETRRQEVKQRQIHLAGFGAHAGSQGAAAIAADRANEIERRQRLQAVQAERATRIAAARAEKARGSEALRAVEAHKEELRQRQQADSALARREVINGRQKDQTAGGHRKGGDAAVVVKPNGKGGEDEKRLRWAERRELDQRERERQQLARREVEQQREREKQAAAQAAAARAGAATGRTFVAANNPPQDRDDSPKPNGLARANGRDDNDSPQARQAREAARQAKAAEQLADRQEQQQRRAERDATQQQRAQQEAAAEQAKRQLRQQEVTAERAQRDQREQERTAQRDSQEAAKRQAAQAEQAQRQQQMEARRQQQAQEAQRDAARDPARQQAAAEERSRQAGERNAERSANESARAAQREASRQAEQQRSAERESARSAERAQRQAESDSRRSQESQRSSDRGSDRGIDRGNSRGR